DRTDPTGRRLSDPATLGSKPGRRLRDLHRTGTGFLMRRGLKIAAWSAAGFAALILLLLAAVLIIGNTDSGRALISRVTAQLTKGHVQLTGIHGSFPAALDLDRLELSDDRGVWLFAEHISLRWSPSALLLRHVKVDSLRVARLHIERAPLPEKEKKPSST